MNLFDLVKRKDKFSDFQGDIEARVERIRMRNHRVIELAPSATIRIRNANEVSSLKEKINALQIVGRRRILGWRNRGLKVSLLAGGKALPKTLLNFRWLIPTKHSFDLIFKNEGTKPLVVDCGPVFDSFKSISSELRGTGIEVGPGLNPRLKPSEQIDPYYLEITKLSDWRELYPSAEVHKFDNVAGLEDRYRVGSAYDFSSVETQSLNYIFSSHVFEHLMNPIGHVEYWKKYLKPDGIVAGVVPDRRFTFDYRQKPSRKDDWLKEYQKIEFAIPDERYERWCRFTSPGSTPENLKARNYSIHVHYYDPENFEALSHILIEHKLIRKFDIRHETGNKDFAFLWWL